MSDKVLIRNELYDFLAAYRYSILCQLENAIDVDDDSYVHIDHDYDCDCDCDSSIERSAFMTKSSGTIANDLLKIIYNDTLSPEALDQLIVIGKLAENIRAGVPTTKQKNSYVEFDETMKALM